MLERTSRCQHCDKPMASVRRTKTYCSESCRKKASRGADLEQRVEDQWIVECLRRMGCIAQVWPVYPWDDSPRILALIVHRQTALYELNLGSIPVVTNADLARALKNCDIADADCGKRLETAIRAFYAARKDRRIRNG